MGGRVELLVRHTQGSQQFSIDTTTTTTALAIPVFNDLCKGHILWQNTDVSDKISFHIKNSSMPSVNLVLSISFGHKKYSILQQKLYNYR